MALTGGRSGAGVAGATGVGGAPTGSGRRALCLGVGLALAALNVVLCNVLAARHYRRLDWTATRVFSLSPRTAAVLAGLRRPVRLTVFMVPPDRYQESLYHETRELVRGFTARAPLITVETLDIDADPTRAEVLARKHGVSAADLREGVVVAEADGRSRYVTAASMARYEVTPSGRRLTAFLGEAALLGAVLGVTAGAPPTVCFLQGHGEALVDSYSPTGLGQLVDEVKRDGYAARAVSGRELLAGLPGCGVLVIGGPTRAVAPVELDALDRALRGGARLLLLLGPVLDRRVTAHGRTGLEGWLAEWGVEVRANIVVDRLAVPGEQPLLTWGTLDGYAADHPVGRALAGRLTVWPLTREVRPAAAPPPGRPGLRATSLVRTSSGGWGETDLASLRGDRPLVFDPTVDTPGPVSVAAAMEWRRARLVVLGTERGVLGARLAGGAARDHNRELILAALAWLAPSSPAGAVAVGPKPTEHVRLLLDEGQLRRVFLIAVVAMPLCSLLLGLFVWRRRRS